MTTLTLFETCINSILTSSSQNELINISQLPLHLRKLLFRCAVSFNLLNDDCRLRCFERADFFKDFSEICISGDDDCRSGYLETLYANLRLTSGVSETVGSLRLSVNPEFNDVENGKKFADNQRVVCNLIGCCPNLKRLELDGVGNSMKTGETRGKFFSEFFQALTTKRLINLQELILHRFTISEDFRYDDDDESDPLFGNLQSIEFDQVILPVNFWKRLLNQCGRALTSAKLTQFSLHSTTDTVTSGHSDIGPIHLPNLSTLNIVETHSVFWEYFWPVLPFCKNLESLSLALSEQHFKLIDLLIDYDRWRNVELEISLIMTTVFQDFVYVEWKNFLETVGQFVDTVRVTGYDYDRSFNSVALFDLITGQCCNLTSFTYCTASSMDVLQRLASFCLSAPEKARKLRHIRSTNLTRWTSVLKLLSVCGNLKSLRATMKDLEAEATADDQVPDAEQLLFDGRTATPTSLSFYNAELIPYQSLMCLLHVCGSNLESISLVYSKPTAIPDDFCRIILENCPKIKFLYTRGNSSGGESDALRQRLEQNFFKAALKDPVQRV